MAKKTVLAVLASMVDIVTILGVSLLVFWGAIYLVSITGVFQMDLGDDLNNLIGVTILWLLAVLSMVCGCLAPLLIHRLCPFAKKHSFYR